MADHYLHGIELIEIEDDGRTVRTVKSSVIGMVGTAPQASTARTATLTLGQGDAALTFTAKAPGALGNTCAYRSAPPLNRRRHWRWPWILASRAPP